MKLFLIICLSLVVHSIFAATRMVDRTVVVINDEAILESDIDAFQKKLRSKSFQELFGGVNGKVTDNRGAVLQLLIEERLVNQQVKKLELTATESEVEGQINAIVKRNGITEAQLMDRLKQLGSSVTEYKEGIKRQIERKNLIDREIRPSMEVTEEQLRHFYQRSINPQETEMEYKIAHILIALKAKGPAAIDDASKRAKTVWAEISKKPEDFEKFVKDFSDDTSTPDGSLGYFPPSLLAKEFRSIVPKTGVGQITAPIKMVDGFHIVKVLESRSPDYTTLPKEKKEAIRNQMMGQEMEKKMSLWLDRKKREANITLVTEPQQEAGKTTENKETK